MPLKFFYLKKRKKPIIFSIFSMLDVTIFWDLMLKKIDVGYVVEMEVHVNLLKAFSMIRCQEEVSVMS